MTKTTTYKSPATERASALRVEGDRYGSAGIAVLAHVIAGNMNDSRKLKRGMAGAIATATGYDKATVSRTVLILTNDDDAFIAARDLNPMLDVSRPANLTRLVNVGLMFTQAAATRIRVALKPTAAPTGDDTTDTTETVAPEADQTREEVDVPALLMEWLETATAKQFTARTDLIADIVARVTEARAA